MEETEEISYCDNPSCLVQDCDGSCMDKKTKEREFTGYEVCFDCGGDLEEIEQIPDINNNGTIFIMECVDCGQKYGVRSVHFIGKWE